MVRLKSAHLNYSQLWSRSRDSLTIFKAFNHWNARLKMNTKLQNNSYNIHHHRRTFMTMLLLKTHKRFPKVYNKNKPRGGRKIRKKVRSIR